MLEKKISILIVDDSAVARELLSYIVNSDPNLEVIGKVTNGMEAVEFIKQHKPNVILMDIHMPRMDGFEATRHIMATCPIPIIICSSENMSDEARSFKALEAGALVILEKPKGISDPNFKNITKHYIDTIKMTSEIKLITRLTTTQAASVSRSSASMPDVVPKKVVEAIAIGASLGGPQALQTILSKIPSDYPIPIFVVQHIAEGFTVSFADWLAKLTLLKIVLAENGMTASKGHVYLPPDGYHLEASKNNLIRLTKRGSDQQLCPSVSRLFSSMAEVYGDRGVGVILTGMGRDGVEELLEMKKKGAITIAQDQASSLMYGMPYEAKAIGACQYVLSLNDIPRFLEELVLPKI